MKWRMLLAWLLFMQTNFLTAQTSDIANLLQEAARLEKNMREKEALAAFKQVLKQQPIQATALTKSSELCSRIGHREKDSHIRDEYYKAAAIYAQTALTYFPQFDESHVAMAIASGRMALTKSGKEKISAVREIREHAEKALALNPNNFKAWHVLGKWHYEMTHLNMMEKAAIRLFYGGLPSSSYSDAIRAYEKARDLNPAFLLNYLELAKSYYAAHQKNKALSSLRIMGTLPNTTQDDSRIRQEALQLINKWQ